MWEEILCDQGNNGHSEARTGHWLNMWSEEK